MIKPLKSVDEIVQPVPRDQMAMIGQQAAELREVVEAYFATHADGFAFDIAGCGGMVESESAYIGDTKVPGTSIDFRWIYSQQKALGEWDPGRDGENLSWAAKNNMLTHALVVSCTVRFADGWPDKIQSCYTHVSYTGKPVFGQGPERISYSSCQGRINITEDEVTNLIEMVHESKARMARQERVAQLRKEVMARGKEERDEIAVD